MEPHLAPHQASTAAVWAQLLVVADMRTGQHACNDFVTCVTGVDHVRSFGVVGDHPIDFFAGADAYHAAYRGVDTMVDLINKKSVFMELFPYF